MDATKAEISANWDRAERRVRELETELKNLELAYAEDNGKLRAELAALKAREERLRKALVAVRKSDFCATTEMVENFDFDNPDCVSERGTGEFICNACGSDPNEHDPSCIVLVIDAALAAQGGDRGAV